MKEAVFINKIAVGDPKTGGVVWLNLYDSVDGMFAIDEASIDQSEQENATIGIPNPYSYSFKPTLIKLKQ